MTDQLPPDHDDEFLDDRPTVASFDIPEPPHPINWNLLGPEDLEAEWLELNRYVFLRLNALPPMTLELKFYTEISSFLHDRV